MLFGVNTEKYIKIETIKYVITKMDEIGKVRVAPLSMIIWDNQDISDGETAIIDTFGYNLIALYLETNDAAIITLAEVSRDKKSWRQVEEVIHQFEFEGKAFIKLNDVIKTKAVLIYRYLKFRVDTVETVKTTLEVTCKLIESAPAIEPIEVLRERTEVIREQLETIRETGVLEINWEPVLMVLTEMNEKLNNLYALTNVEDWDNDHKLVEMPGTAVRLPPHEIADGHPIVVRAIPTNLGNVYVGKSKTKAEDALTNIPLDANEAVKLDVKNANAVWINADVAGEGVVYWFEKKKV